MARYNGEVQGLCMVDTATHLTPAAFCAKVEGGSISIDEAVIENFGIGDVKVVRGGTIEAALSMQCIGVDKAQLAKWFPVTKGVQVASFPAAASGFLVEADDGTNGFEFLLDTCQPGAATISISQARDAQVVYDLSVMAALPDLQAANTTAPAYNAYIGHTINDIKVQKGGVDIGALSFSLSNGLAIVESNPMNTKSAGAKRLPSGYYITTVAPTLTIDTEDKGTWLANMLDDSLPTAANFTIVMANGTAGENITITCTNFQPTSWGMDLAPQGLVGFRHTFVPGTGTIFNRVTFA